MTKKGRFGAEFRAVPRERFFAVRRYPVFLKNRRGRARARFRRLLSTVLLLYCSASPGPWDSLGNVGETKGAISAQVTGWALRPAQGRPFDRLRACKLPAGLAGNGSVPARIAGVVDSMDLLNVQQNAACPEYGEEDVTIRGYRCLGSYWGLAQANWKAPR